MNRWNRVLTSEKSTFNIKPNTFLVDMASVRVPGMALDVGMGQGRNSLWLVENGWKVTGFDPAHEAVAVGVSTARSLGLRLIAETRTAESFDFGEDCWDLILHSYVGVRTVKQKVEKGLNRNGILVLEAFHKEANKELPIGAEVQFASGELINLFAGLQVLHYEEPIVMADFGQKRVRIVRFCGKRV